MKFLLAFLLAFPVGAWALSPGDGVTIYFKDGSSVTGNLVELTAGLVTISVGTIDATWDMRAVARIENTFGSPPAGQPTTQMADAAPLVSAASQTNPSSNGMPQTTLPPPPAPNGFAPTVAPPLGYGTNPAYYGQIYVGVPIVLGTQRFSQADQDGFLKAQAAQREARKRQITTPESDFQFNLQQALDRQAHGLPFSNQAR